MKHLCLQCGKELKKSQKLFCSDKCKKEYKEHEEYCPVCMSESDKL